MRPLAWFPPPSAGLYVSGIDVIPSFDMIWLGLLRPSLRHRLVTPSVHAGYQLVPVASLPIFILLLLSSPTH